MQWELGIGFRATIVDPHIENLKSTTFFGRRFTRRQIAEVQQTVAMFPALSRKELSRLRRENRQLKMDREILSKAAAWFARETNSTR